MNKARLPTIELQIEENPGYKTEAFASSQEAEEEPLEEPRRTVLDQLKASVHWVLLFLSVSVFLLILRRIVSSKGISIRSFLAERKRRRADAETTYFKRFRKASLSNDAKTTLRELMFWLDRVNTRPIAPTLEQFAKETHMPGLLEEEDALNAFLFARPANADPLEFRRAWSARAFHRVVAQARKAYIGKAERQPSSAEQTLSLNPGGTRGE